MALCVYVNDTYKTLLKPSVYILFCVKNIKSEIEFSIYNRNTSSTHIKV